VIKCMLCRFLGLNFMVPNSWFTYQNVRTEEYEDEKSPLSMEGFGQAISLFLVSIFVLFCLLSTLGSDKHIGIA